jgi:Raf kinase inhibitor-like YbhB/YbcL family protein
VSNSEKETCLMAFALQSPAFENGARIPTKYTLDGDNLSPPLEWQDAPSGTKSFVLVVEDPDAPNGTFRHWALYNIGHEHDRLPEGIGRDGQNLGMGVNDFGHHRYDGPQPPRGHGVHHYHFKLAALDVDSLNQSPKASVNEIWSAAKKHVLGEVEIVGTYER